MGDGEGISVDKEEEEVTDTPARSKNNQIAGVESKFEDSPVYTFLNNLSPINQVKSTHITQTIDPHSFSSVPSVFNSPHVSSLRGSRFIRRHQFSDPSKPEFSSDDANIADKTKKMLEISEKINEQQQNLNPKAFDGEIAGDPSYERSKLVFGFEESFTYYCGNFNSKLQPSSCLKAKHLAEYTCSSSAFVLSVEESFQRGIYGNEVNQEGVDQIGQDKEVSSCDWENLISNASDLLNFESPNNTESFKKPENVGEGSHPENVSTQHKQGSETIENAESNDIINNCQTIDNPGQNVDSEQVSGFYRGMKRRCLVFEMAGSGRKQLDKISDSDSSVLLQSDGNSAFSNGQVKKSTGNNSSRCVLPGIGLHLNTLATTPKDKILNHEPGTSAKLLIGPSSSVNFHPPITGHELVLASSQRETDTFENGAMPVEELEAGQVSGYLANEEISQASPKRKRRKSEQGVEGESCKRCNCRKSKCLKLYCECFAAGVYCVEPCACIDCFNKPAHVDTVLATRKQIESRNPLAFAPTVIRGSDSLSETTYDSSKTPASARHKRGCNCKKSGCLKKYCECYQGGVGCSVNCRCEGCKNAFGRKDGFGVTRMEVEFEEYAADMTEKNVPDKVFKKTAMQNDLERKMDSAPLVTPSRVVRESFQHPNSSNERPPRSSVSSMGNSSDYSSSQVYAGKESLFQPKPFLEKHSEAIGEDEIPRILQESFPITGVKSSSPNKKRVSPPHVEGMMRGSRRLILRSIPSFPDLTTNQ